MKNLRKVVFLALISVVILSCSKEDEAIVTTVTTANVTNSIDENSAQSTTVGTVTGASNTGTVVFSITTQTPSGALAVNASTGELRIADASVFDFETNPTITATVRVADGEVAKNANVTINLNDKDDIEFLLSTSKTTYNNASTNTWVKITEAEYDNLAEKLNNVSVTGATEADFNSSVTTEFGSSPQYTLANIDASTTIPNAGYLFAFKYEAKSSGHAVTVTTAQVKQSSSSNHDGFVNLGNNLPSHSVNNLTETFYFVLKGNATATTAKGYMAFAKQSNMNPTFKRIAGATYHYTPGNESNLSSTIYNGGGSGVQWLHQGLATTQKQW